MDLRFEIDGLTGEFAKTGGITLSVSKVLLTNIHRGRIAFFTVLTACIAFSYSPKDA